MPKDERLTTHVNEPVKDAFDELADERGLTTSSYLRMVLLDHLRDVGRMPGQEADEEGNPKPRQMAKAD